MTSFDCTKCGACCKSLEGHPLTTHLDRGDGTCKHLREDNTCRIYETRPDICRVDKMQPAVMTTVEWHRRNKHACRQLHLHVYGQPLR